VGVEKVPFATVNVENNDTIGTGMASAPTATPTSSSSSEDPHQYWQKLNINLERFGEKIKDYSDIEAEVSEIKTIHEIDFIKVNVQVCMLLSFILNPLLNYYVIVFYT
jgi:hypothetical protein